MTKCNLPKNGWKCKRDAGHDGPCAALPIAQPSEDSARLDVIQARAADWDMYAEAAGRWSIRERSGERTLFRSIRECADALIRLGEH